MEGPPNDLVVCRSLSSEADVGEVIAVWPEMEVEVYGQVCGSVLTLMTRVVHWLISDL